MLAESGESYEADPAQFVALKERYIFFAKRLRYGTGEDRHHLYIKGDGPWTKTLRDVRGRNVRGQLIFRESELKATELPGDGLPECQEKTEAKFVGAGSFCLAGGL